MTRMKNFDSLSPEEREQKVVFNHFPTPSQFIRHALRYVLAKGDISWALSPRVLDHSCGTGVWNAVMSELNPSSHRTNVELQVASPIRPETADEWHYGDRFQDWAREHAERRFELIIGNPPFFEAQEFVEVSFALLDQWGIHVALLPSNFLSTQDRTVTLHRTLTPKYVITIPKRLSFTKNGKTDNKEYMLFVWQKGSHADYAQLDFHFDWWMDAPDLPEDVVFNGMGSDMVQVPLWNGRET